MWLADANLAATETFGVSGINANGSMTWDTANIWIGGMNTANWLGFSDWRLPTALNLDGTGPEYGYGEVVKGSEMNHLFYDELGGTAASAISTSGDPDLSLFANLQDEIYWSGTAANPFDVWGFNFGNGNAGTMPKVFTTYYALAVRSDASLLPCPNPQLLPSSESA